MKSTLLEPGLHLSHGAFLELIGVLYNHFQIYKAASQSIESFPVKEGSSFPYYLTASPLLF